MKLFHVNETDERQNDQRVLLVSPSNDLEKGPSNNHESNEGDSSSPARGQPKYLLAFGYASCSLMYLCLAIAVAITCESAGSAMEKRIGGAFTTLFGLILAAQEAQKCDQALKGKPNDQTVPLNDVDVETGESNPPNQDDSRGPAGDNMV